MPPKHPGLGRLVLLGLVFVTVVLLLRGVAVAQEPLPGQYRISSRSSGKCLDAERGSRIAGSKVQEWDCHGGLNQRFRLIRFGDAWIVRAMHSDLCLTVAEEEAWFRVPANGLYQADCRGTANQFFEFSPPPTDPDSGAARVEGEYRIEQGGRCLTVRETDSLTAAESQPALFSVSLQSCDIRPLPGQSWELW